MKRSLFFASLGLVVLMAGLGFVYRDISPLSSINTPIGFEGQMWNSTMALYGTLGKSTHFLCTTEAITKVTGGYILLSAGHCTQLPPPGLQFSVADEIGDTRTDVMLMKTYMGDGIDFALFYFPTTRYYPVMTLGEDPQLQVGSAVFNVNFAVGYGKQLSRGTVSSQALVSSYVCGLECKDYFIVQMGGAGGSSGSPVISKRTHTVIGIVIWGFDEPGDNTGLGIEPISKFAVFLAGPNQPHPILDDEEDDD